MLSAANKYAAYEMISDEAKIAEFLMKDVKPLKGNAQNAQRELPTHIKRVPFYGFQWR